MSRSFIQMAIVSLAALMFILGSVGPTAAESSVDIEVFAPRNGDVAGVQNRAFLVDLVARFDGDLASTGASPELTGPGAHMNIPPFPGNSTPGANADHFPGLVVLLSTSMVGAGPGQNLANLFNIVAVTNRKNDEETDIWSTWIIGAANFGTGQSRLFVAVVEGTAPNVVQDLDQNGVFDEKDLRQMGAMVISNV